MTQWNNEGLDFYAVSGGDNTVVGFGVGLGPNLNGDVLTPEALQQLVESAPGSDLTDEDGQVIGTIRDATLVDNSYQITAQVDPDWFRKIYAPKGSMLSVSNSVVECLSSKQD